MNDFEQVKLLFDYTKFHIGLYSALIAAMVTALNLRSKLNFSVNAEWALAAVLFIAVAGLAGGTIASSLPHFTSIKTFWTTRLGPYRLELFAGETWTYIEHSAFWAGVICGLVAVFK
jgi:hypothetical protein